MYVCMWSYIYIDIYICIYYTHTLSLSLAQIHAWSSALCIHEIHMLHVEFSIFFYDEDISVVFFKSRLETFSCMQE